MQQTPGSPAGHHHDMSTVRNIRFVSPDNLPDNPPQAISPDRLSHFAGNYHPQPDLRLRPTNNMQGEELVPGPLALLKDQVKLSAFAQGFHRARTTLESQTARRLRCLSLLLFSTRRPAFVDILCRNPWRLNLRLRLG